MLPVLLRTQPMIRDTLATLRIIANLMDRQLSTGKLHRIHRLTQRALTIADPMETMVSQMML